jgi:hypothetical protein
VKRVASRITGHWIQSQPERPSPAEIKKQGAVAKRIAESQPEKRVDAALDGITGVYPYSDGAPWDVFDLERKFSKAAAAGAAKTNGSAPDYGRLP